MAEYREVVDEIGEYEAILRDEALSYENPKGVPVFGSAVKCAPEKAIVANSSAVREWDSNGTNFGFALRPWAEKF